MPDPRCHKAPLVSDYRDATSRWDDEPMAARADMLYGVGIASNYQGQGLKLSKHFKAE